MMKRAVTVVIILLITFAVVTYVRPLAVFDVARHAYLLARGFHSEYVIVGGHRIHYMTGSEGAPLLLVHGLASRGEDYFLVMPQLARSHRLFIPDLLGFGWSDRPNSEYTVADEEQMIRGFRDAMRIEKCDVVAMSMGGWIAMKLAAENPERVRRLVLVDSAGFQFSTSMTETTFTPSNREELRRFIDLQTDKFPYIPGFIARDLLRANKEHAWILRRALHAMLAGGDLMDHRVDRLTMPVLLIWGEKDRITPLVVGQRMQREMPHARLITYRDCGHLAIVECRDRALPAIESFLR